MTDGTLPTLLPTRKLSHSTPSGKVLTYTVTTLTEGCYLVEADQSPEVLQFASFVALKRWWQRLQLSLEETCTQATWSESE